jgi:hypothetical protein
VLSAIALLALSAHHSHRCGLRIWKSSMLPLLYRTLDPDLLARQPVLHDVSTMTGVAGKAKVTLVETSREDGVVLTQGLARWLDCRAGFATSIAETHSSVHLLIIECLSTSKYIGSIVLIDVNLTVAAQYIAISYNPSQSPHSQFRSCSNALPAPHNASSP